MNKLKKIFLSFSRRERAIFIAASFLFIIAALSLGSSLINKITQAVPVSGGDYAEGIVGQPATINPVTATTEVDKSLVRLIFSRLGDIATKIESSDNGKTWRVRLTEGVLWSDGEKLTSDDIIFTIQKIQDPDSKSPLISNWNGVAMTRTSELELQFILATPYAFFQNNLENLYILPRHLFKDVPVTNWKISSYNLSPVGSGPYEFTSYDKKGDGFITTHHLHANQRYFADKPLIQNFDFRFFPDSESLIEAFNKGMIDGIAGLPFGSLSEIKRTYELLSFKMPSYYAAFFNQSRNDALKEVAVRRALTLATPKQKLITEVFDGKAEIVNGPVPPSAAHFDPDIRGGEDLELAKSLLDQAGWKIDPGQPSSSVRTKTAGKKTVALELNLTVPQIPFLIKTAQALQDSWQKIGVKVNLVILPPEEIVKNTIENRDYEILLFGNVLNENSDLFSFWHSSEKFYPGLNLSMYSNKRADQLIEKIRQSGASQDLASMFNDLQETIVIDYPAIFLYSPDYIYVANTNLKGAEAGFIAEPADRLRGVAKWHLKTARVLK